MLSTKKIILISLKVGISFIALYLISRKVTINPFDYLDKAHIKYILIAFTLNLFLIFIQASRWRSIVKMYAINIPYKKSLIAVWSGHLINNVLPTATAGDMLRNYSIKHFDANKRKGKWVNIFLAEKYSAATSAILLALMSLVTPIASQLPNALRVSLCVLFVLLLLTPVLVVKFTEMFDLINIRIVRFIREINLKFSDTFFDRNGRSAFIDSFLINFCMCAMFYFIAMGLGIEIEFAQCLFVVPMFTILASLPISYAGWGVREFSCVALLQYFGLSTEKAVIISIMYGLVILLSCLPGVFVTYPFLTMKQKF